MCEISALIRQEYMEKDLNGFLMFKHHCRF